MHTDLSPHLHTPECNQLIEELKSCHGNNTFGKFVGICNSIDAKLTKCLKAERVARSAANRAKSIAQLERYRQRLKAEAETKANKNL